jgi:rubredoxin
MVFILRGVAAAACRNRSEERAGMKVWQCRTCGYVYDEAVGDPDGGVPPGTAWEDVPANWVCPKCGTAKSDFDKVAI